MLCGSQVDVQDERFHELFDNPLFNIDPSAPEFKKTKAMDSLIEEKVKRRKLQKSKFVSTFGNSQREEAVSLTKGKEDHGRHLDNMATAKKGKEQSLASLVKSVKAKTKSLQEKKGKR